MKINVAKSAGFCFGVRRAITIAKEIARTGTKSIYMLGDIVHNEDVVKDIRASGIKKIRSLAKKTSAILLIRAHGASRNTLRKARRLGYTIVDATCPMVKEIHTIVREAGRKYPIIVIGDPTHEEVKGIVGQLSKGACVIDSTGAFPAQKIARLKKACVVVQSTQNIEKVLAIVERLKKDIPDLVFHNTICRPTRLKQQEIRAMPLENDVMVVIGSKKSANTKRLYEISAALNKRTYWINSSGEIKPAWFAGAASVGIASGASTPESTTAAVIQRINAVCGNA